MRWSNLMFSFDIGNHVTLLNLGTLLGVNFHKFAAQRSVYLYKLAPRCHDVAEHVTLVVCLANEWLDSRCGLALALELPEDLTLHRSHDGIGLGVLELGKLLCAHAGAKFSILRFLQIGKHILLCLSTL